jgi:hypothetical protein
MHDFLKSPYEKLVTGAQYTYLEGFYASLPSTYLSFKIYAVTFNEVIGVVLKCAGQTIKL